MAQRTQHNHATLSRSSVSYQESQIATATIT